MFNISVPVNSFTNGRATNNASAEIELNGKGKIRERNEHKVDLLNGFGISLS